MEVHGKISRALHIFYYYFKHIYIFFGQRESGLSEGTNAGKVRNSDLISFNIHIKFILYLSGIYILNGFLVDFFVSIELSFQF